MRDRLFRRLTSALLLGALAAPAPAHGYIANDRWNFTATNGTTGPQGSPVTVTWSFAPDGTNVQGPASNLISFLDTNFGAGSGNADYTQRPWFSIFDQSFARLNALAGVTFVYEPHDDGAAFSSVTRGVIGIRGDQRLGGKSYGAGNSTLASNFFPDWSDMMINTDQAGFLANPVNNYRGFRNTLMHELMHGLGISHVSSSDARFLIEPVLGTSFDGPQLDDILAMQRLYGDVLEKNGGNDTAAAATLLGTLGEGQPLVRGTLGDSTVVAGTAVDFLSIDDNSDTDFYRFTLNQPLAVTLSVTPKGTSYQTTNPDTSLPETTFNSRELSDLSLALFDANGVVQLGSTADANGLGGGETIVRELNSGSYLARIKGAQDDVQLYQLAVSGSAIGPDNLTWVGAEAGVWNAGATANFQNATGADTFRNGDQVLFGNGAVTAAVFVDGPVSPAAMTVNSASNYTFLGAGISAATLLVDGGGSVTLGNQANAFQSINVLAGSLKFTGAGNAPLTGAVHVAAGATLELGAPQPLAASSQLTGAGNVIGSVVMPGTLAPGESIGKLTIDGDLTLTSTSVLSIELGGLTAGTEFDMLQTTGNATLGGSLSVSLVAGFQPTPGSMFSIMAIGGTTTGTFATEQLPDLGGGLIWHTAYLPHEVVLSVSAGVSFAAADFNEDGFIDAADLTIWQNGFGLSTGASHGQGDANGDFAVDGADFLIWQTGVNNPGNVGTQAPAPEPKSWIVALAGLAGLPGLRRGRFGETSRGHSKQGA